MNYRTAILAFSLVIPVLAQAPQPNGSKPDPSKVVLTIGDIKVTEAEFEETLAAMPPQYQQQARSGPGRRAFAEQYVQLRLLADQAVKDKLDQSEKVKKQVAFSNMSVYASAMFQSIQDNVKIDDAAIENITTITKPNMRS